MKSLENLKELAAVFANMCNGEDDCLFITARIHCPFCGSNDIIISEFYGEFNVGCNSCGAEGPYTASDVQY